MSRKFGIDLNCKNTIRKFREERRIDLRQKKAEGKGAVFRSYSLRFPGAKILQGCVVAIDSGGHPYAPSFSSLLQARSLPFPRLLPRHISPLSLYHYPLPSPAACLPRSGLVAEISRLLLLAVLTPTHAEGVKTIPSSQLLPRSF